MAAKAQRPRAANWALRPARAALSQRGEFVRAFILANGFPDWGQPLEQALRTKLSTSGFRVTRCACLVEHPVVSLRMQGQAGATLRQVRQHLRHAVQQVGYRVTEITPVSVSKSGQVTGAFVLDAEIGKGVRRW
jgi:hypothetical protein